MGGRPDDHLPKVGWIIWTAFVFALVWTTYLFIRSKAPSTWKPPFTFGVLGGILVAQISIIEANLDAPSSQSAESLTGWSTVLFFAGWALFGFAAFLVERR